MENIVWRAASSATSILSAGGGELSGPQKQRTRHAQAVAATLGQLNRQAARKCVYIDDTPAMAAATFAGMSGLRTWSPPV